MPTYEYLCPACGVVEALQSMREPPLTTCPICGKEAVTRLVSRGAGVIFKGSGFWETDYNRPTSGSASGSDAMPSSSADSAPPEPLAPQAQPKTRPSDDSQA